MHFHLLSASFPYRHRSDGLDCLLHRYKTRRVSKLSALKRKLSAVFHDPNQRARKGSDISAEELDDFCTPRVEELWWNSEGMRRQADIIEMKGLWDQVFGDGWSRECEGDWQELDGEGWEGWARRDDDMAQTEVVRTKRPAGAEMETVVEEEAANAGTEVGNGDAQTPMRELDQHREPRSERGRATKRIS